MSRGDTQVRQFRLMRLLEERRELAVNQMAAELGYSRRTVYRDLMVLQRVGVPLYQERDGKRSRWRVLDGYRHRLRLTLSWSEMLALSTGREILRGLSGTLFHESAVSALDKIRDALPKELAARAVAAAGAVSAQLGPTHDYRAFGNTVETLVSAVEAHRTVRLSYRKRGSQRFATRLVDPYHLHVQTGALYLLGWCHRRRGLRTFLVDRTNHVELTPETFERRADVQPGSVLHGSFGPWSGEAVKSHLHFSAHVAPLVAERGVHPTQANQLRDDGSLDVTLKAPLSPALVAWVVGWAADVRVLRPKALETAVRQAHEAALRTRNVLENA